MQQRDDDQVQPKVVERFERWQSEKHAAVADDPPGVRRDANGAIVDCGLIGGALTPVPVVPVAPKRRADVLFDLLLAIGQDLHAARLQRTGDPWPSQTARAWADSFRTAWTAAGRPGEPPEAAAPEASTPRPSGPPAAPGSAAVPTPDPTESSGA